jgi:hypothetical protein
MRALSGQELGLGLKKNPLIKLNMNRERASRSIACYRISILLRAGRGEPSHRQICIPGIRTDARKVLGDA